LALLFVVVVAAAVAFQAMQLLALIKCSASVKGEKSRPLMVNNKDTRTYKQDPSMHGNLALIKQIRQIKMKMWLSK